MISNTPNTFWLKLRRLREIKDNPPQSAGQNAGLAGGNYAVRHEVHQDDVDWPLRACLPTTSLMLPFSLMKKPLRRGKAYNLPVYLCH